MSLELLRANVAGIQAALDGLESEAKANTQTRTRAVSIKAKNVQCGNLVEWGYGVGQREVAGWGMMGGEVILHAQNAPLWPVGGEERVRVYR